MVCLIGGGYWGQDMAQLSIASELAGWGQGGNPAARGTARELRSICDQSPWGNGCRGN